MQATLTSKAMVWIKESKGYKSDCKATGGLSYLVQRGMATESQGIRADVCRVGKSLSFRTSLGQACFVLLALTLNAHQIWPSKILRGKNHE